MESHACLKGHVYMYRLRQWLNPHAWLGRFYDGFLDWFLFLWNRSWAKGWIYLIANTLSVSFENQSRLLLLFLQENLILPGYLLMVIVVGRFLIALVICL